VTRRRLALLAGVATLVAGLIAAGFPGFVAVGLDRAVLSVVGGLALLQAWRVVERRRREGIDEAATPDPERSVATPPPGEEFGPVLGEFLDTRHLHHRRTRVREGLRAAARAALAQYGSHTEAEAREAVAAGTWTDDVHAASLLGDERAPSVPRRSRLEAAIRRESPFQRSVRHAVDEIAAAAGVATGADGATTAVRDPADRPDASPAGTDPPDRPDADGDTGVVREAHPTGHWRGVSAVALVGIGVGVLVAQPAVVLSGVVGVGFAAYARSRSLPPGPVRLDRTLDADRPAPGDDVTGTVTVTNASDRFLPDLRIVDGVPDAVDVADGTPRFGTALRAGERATFSYAVTARRGVHEFGPATLVARDLAGAVEEERSLDAETTLTCIPPLEPLAAPVPLRNRATRYVGRVETDRGGDGVEFAATREYRPGDSIRRIDWNRRARTGDLTTVEFREERAATVVLAIDARPPAYVSPTPHAAHAVDRAVDAAGRLFTSLAESGDRVGITALSAESCWLAPGAGVDHRAEARELLATHPALSPTPTEGPAGMIRWRRRLRKRLDAGTQVVFLTPLVDDYASRFARLVDEYGFPTTVVAPDPSVDRTASHRLSRVARALRISSLRSAGVPVVDWSWDDPVDVALARYGERRSR
jgi:uncharacterized protein (DUF58 family)